MITPRQALDRPRQPKTAPDSPRQHQTSPRLSAPDSPRQQSEVTKPFGDPRKTRFPFMLRQADDGKRPRALDVWNSIGDEIEDRGGVRGGESGRRLGLIPAGRIYEICVSSRRDAHFGEARVPQKGSKRLMR